MYNMDRIATYTKKIPGKMKTKDNKSLTVLIGIDPGVNTGIAIKYLGEYKMVKSVAIHEALNLVRDAVNAYLQSILIRVEDARLRTWFGSKSRDQLQGAGSIKRDCKIWEDFLTDLGVDYEMVPPKNNKTKVSASYFKEITGWELKTNEHSRDAAMLIF